MNKPFFPSYFQTQEQYNRIQITRGDDYDDELKKKKEKEKSESKEQENIMKDKRTNLEKLITKKKVATGIYR